jgi:Antitoxin Xre-like helix-turn-helix domain
MSISAYTIRPAVDPGPPPVAPNLADAATRLRLTPAAVDGMVKLAEIWRLTSSEACALLGDVSERTWFRMKKGERTGDLSQDVLTRISALIGIFKGLRLLFSEPLSDEWIRLPNKGPVYGGRRPLDVLIEGGIPKMLEVRRHIDALRGGL